VRAGNQVSVLSLTSDREKSIDTMDGVDVYRIPLPNIYWPFGETRNRRLHQKFIWHILDMWNPFIYWRTLRFLDKVKPEVLHTNNIRGMSVSVWSAARNRNIPVVHTLRDYSIACARGGMFHRGKNCEQQCGTCRVLTFNKRKASRLVDIVVSNSAFTLKRHQNSGFFGGLPAKVIFNIAKTPEIKAEKNLAASSLRFGYIGRIEQMKGIRIVLEAFSRLEDAECRLVIAGTGEFKYLKSLQKEFADIRINWLGFVEEKAFYDQIDVSIVPSIWHEPLPRALIEAFTYNKAAICSDVGGNVEIGRLGKKVEIFRNENVDDLAKLMRSALADPDKWRYGGFIDDEARKKLGEKVIVEAYTNTYVSAINGRGVK